MIDIEQRVADEYMDERFPGTFEDVQARVARRSRTRWALMAGAVATAAAVVVGFAVIRPSHDQRPVIAATPSSTASKRLTAAEFDAACTQRWEDFKARRQLQGDLAERPPLRFDEQLGDRRMQVYANSVMELECSQNAAGELIGGDGTGEPLGERILRPIGREFQAFGSLGADHYYLGGLIPGATAITAHIPGRADVPAKVNGDLFLLWYPGGADADNMVITARSQKATLVDMFTFSNQRPDERTATIDASCRALIDGLVHQAGSILASVASQPTTLAVKSGSGDHRTWIYRKGALLVPCDLGDKGSRSDRLGTALLADAPDEWQTAGHVEVMTGGMINKWGRVFGAAPAGLTSLVLHLPDGQTIAATISNGMYLAVWRTTDWEVQPDSITATVKGVQYTIEPDGTVH